MFILMLIHHIWLHHDQQIDDMPSLTDVGSQVVWLCAGSRSPTVFISLKPDEVVVAFQNYLLHVLPQADRGRESAYQWRCKRGYVTWFYNVSRHILKTGIISNHVVLLADTN